MKKIIVLTLILFLLSSVVSAQDLTGDQPVLINIGGIMVNELDIEGPLFLETGVPKEIATATAPLSPTDTGYVEGATSYEANIKIYGPDGQDNYVEVQNNFVSAAPGKKYSLTVTVNEVEMTGDGYQIIIPDGQTETYYAYSSTLSPSNYVELIVTNQPEVVTETPVSTGSGGSGKAPAPVTYTQEKTQKIQDNIRAVIGTLSLTLAQQEVIAGQLNLVFTSGDIDAGLEDLFEGIIRFTFNQWDPFGGLFDTIVKGNADADADGIPDSIEPSQKKLGQCECKVKKTIEFSGCSVKKSLEDQVDITPSDEPLNTAWTTVTTERDEEGTATAQHRETNFEGIGGSTLSVPIIPGNGIDLSKPITCSAESYYDLGVCELENGECPPESGMTCDKQCDGKDLLSDDAQESLKTCVEFVEANTEECSEKSSTDNEGVCKEGEAGAPPSGGGGTSGGGGEVTPTPTVTQAPVVTQEIPRPKVPVLTIRKKGICICNGKVAGDFFCSGSDGDFSNPEDEGWSDEFKERVPRQQGSAPLPAGYDSSSYKSNFLGKWPDGTEVYVVHMEILESPNDPTTVTWQSHFATGRGGDPEDLLSSGYCSFEMDNMLDGECDVESSDADNYCKDQCAAIANAKVNGCRDKKENKCEGDFQPGPYYGYDDQGNKVEPAKDAISGECKVVEESAQPSSSEVPAPTSG